MMIHYNQKRHQTAGDIDRDSAGLEAGAVVDPVDPEKFFDELPQPFRFINKTIEALVSNACDQVDSAMLARARSMRLSKQQLSDLSCLELVAEDSELAKSTTPLYPIGSSMLVFCSTEGNLILWDSSEMASLDALPLGEQKLIKVDSFEVSPTRFLLVILTYKADQSMMTVLGVLNSKLHILTQQEIGIQDAIATECLISLRAEFLAVSYTASDEARCVEIYTLQSDAWFRTLDAALVAAAAAQARASSPSSQSGLPVSTEEVLTVANPVAGSSSTSQAPATAATASGPNNAGNAPAVAPAPMFVSAEPERPKIAACGLTLRFKYPSINASSTLSQFIKASELSDGLCLGTNHLLTPTFLSLRQNLHISRQSSLIPTEFVDRLSMPIPPAPKKAVLCAWLTESKFVVAWPEVSALVVYSAIKPPPQGSKGMMMSSAAGSDQVDGRPESSWPLSSPVIALSTSPSRHVVAVLLEKGIIMVLNSGNFTTVGNTFTWALSANLSLSPAPATTRKFSIVQCDRILLETSSVLPSTAYNFAALIRYQDTSASMNTLWKFNSLDIGSEFAFVEVFEQWPTVAFLGLPDGALLLCEKDAFSRRLTQIRLPTGYVWPTPKSGESEPPALRLTTDGRILFAVAHYESPFIAIQADTSNKLFRFDLVSNLPAHLVSRWNPTALANVKATTVKSTITSIANQVIKQSVCTSTDTTERLKKLWAEERDRNKDSRA